MKNIFAFLLACSILCTLCGFTPTSSRNPLGQSGTLGQSSVEKSFREFFPDEVFAQNVAQHFGKSMHDLTSEDELATLTNFSSSAGYWDGTVADITGIEFLHNLQKFELIYHKVSELPDSFSDLKQLEHVSLYGNAFTEFPLQLCYLPKLQELDIAGDNPRNQYTYIPDEIGNLTTLRYLRIGSNKVKSLPEAFGNLQNLTTFHSGCFNLQSLPDSFCELENLEILKLYENDLRQLPESIGNLRNLKSLDIYGNQLTALPDSLWDLSNLQYLRLSKNRLHEIPESISRLSSLETLTIGGMRNISTLPESIAQMPQLKSLSVTECGIVSLPDAIWGLFDNQITDYSLKGQRATLQAKTLHTSEITAINLLPDLLLQGYAFEGVEPYWNTERCSWRIWSNDTNDPFELRIENDAIDAIDLKQGNYTVSFATNSGMSPEKGSYLFNQSYTIPLHVVQDEANAYSINITTKYLDGVLPDHTNSFQVADGNPFQHTLDILDGYEFAGISLLSNLHTFDPATNTLSIDSVERDFDFVLEFDKALHKVAVTVHYLDDAAPDGTQTFWVEHWSPFSQQLDILEGYELAGVSVRANTHTYDPATNTLSIDSVERDFEFFLEYDRIEYTVKVTVQYPDGSEQEMNYPVLYGDPMDVVFDVKDGYRAVSYRTGETGFSINLRSNSLKVNRVAKNMEFTILCG